MSIGSARIWGALGLLAGMLAAAVGCGGLGGSDSDGIQGGTFSFDVTVDDTAFSPAILKAQNVATVTVTLKNAGTKPHDFVVDCMGTACFPDGGATGPVAPDASATVQFTTPATEGIYGFHSDLPGDTQTGQFVVQ